MADKKFKTGVDLQSTVKISSETAEKAMILDASGNLVSSTTSDAELAHLSGVTSSVQTQLTSAQDDATQALSDAAAAQGTADDAIPSAEKGANSGVATLDAGGKIPAAQLPNSVMEYQGGHDVATNTPTLIDGTGNAGDVYKITVGGPRDYGSGTQTFAAGDWIMYSGTIWEKSINSDAVDSVNGLQGTVVLDADDISDSATTNKFVVAGDITKLGHISVSQAVDLDTMESDIALNNAKVSADGLVTTHSDVTDAGSGIIISGAERTKLNGIEAAATADQSGAEIKVAYEAEDDTNAFDDAAVAKLGGIEALADVTDAVNVAASGATMDSDTSLAGNSYFLDEDNMASDSATKVPSQQSVKAYVDAQAAAGGNLSAGDIKETSFSGAADTATTLDVTGLAFANGTVRSFDSHISVVIDAAANLYETFRLSGIQKAAGWDMSVEATGDDSLVSFSITAAGQVQYSKSTTATWVSTTIKFRADTTSI